MKKNVFLLLAVVLLGVATVAVHAEDITLQFWTFSEFSSGDLIKAQMPAIEKFEADHPGVKVQVTGMGDDELLMSLTTAAMANQMPDLFVTNAYDGAPVANYGGIVNIYDKWNAEPQEWLDQFDTFVVDLFSPEEGVMYSMPYTGWADILYRNIDVLEAAGIDINEPIKDWDDFAAQCKQIYETTGAYCTFDNTQAFSDWMAFYAGIASLEEASIDFENLKSLYNPEKIAKTTEFLAEIAPYCASVGNSDQASKDLFIGNKMAYYIDGPWTDITFRQSDVNYDYGWVPGATEGDYGGRSGYELMCVGNTKNADLAYELGKALVESDTMLRWAAVDQRFFANKLAAQAAIDSGSAIEKVVVGAMEYAIPVQLPYFHESYPGNFFSPIMDYVASAMDGSVDFYDGVEDVVEEMNEILEEEFAY